MDETVINEQRLAFLRKIGKRGGLKRAQAFTSDYQRKARACVRHESNVANGRKGGIAYVRKYGKRKLVEQARQYRLNHPSDLERIVESALIAIGATQFEREGYLFPRSRVHYNTGDFVFRKSHCVVYADGATWHASNTQELHSSLAECADRASRDEAMDNYLRGQGWRILRLSEDEIRAYARGNDGALVGKLLEFFGQMDKRRKRLSANVPRVKSPKSQF